MSTLTTAYEYTNLPLRPRITIKSPDGEDTYFTFNGFNSPANDLNIHYIDMEGAVRETGSFNIIAADPSGLINKDHIHNVKVYLELGRASTSFQTFLIGRADITTPRRPNTGYLEYLISGPSTMIKAAELMLLIRKATDKTNNPDYAVGNLVEESLTGRKWRPLNREDIEEVTGWTIGDDGIDKTGLNVINFPRINEVFTTEWDFLERMASMTGAEWYIDYSQAVYPFTATPDTNEIFTMRFPSAEHSGITIKSGDLKTAADKGAKTGYILDSFQVEDNSSADANVATRLYTTNIIDQQSISSSFTNAGFTTLTSRAIAQQFVVQNDQRRIEDLAFILSKVGNPESPNDRINGDMVLDFGDNTPRGKVLATFKIDLNDVKTTPETIFVNDVDIKVRFLQGNNFVWIRVFQRSGLDGDPNTDNANAIRWHHNGQTSAVQTAYSAVSTNNGGDYSLRDNMTWQATNNGPTYTYGVFSNIRRLLARTNASATRTLGVKEAFLDTSFVSDVASANRLLSITLAQRSKARRSIPEFTVTNPIGTLFRPYQWVTFHDGLSDIAQDLQVQRARYVISALPGDPGIGAYWCYVTLGGSYNTLIGDCSCV